MNQFDHQWQRLTALARQAPADRDTAVPPGFATRVTAQAAATTTAGPWFTLERFALRGLLVAAACSVAAGAYNFSILESDQSDIYTTGTVDTIVEMLDIS